MAGEMHLDTLGQKALPTALTATGKSGATVLGLHTGAKAELTLARALGCLVSTFRHGNVKKGAQNSGPQGDVNGGKREFSEAATRACGLRPRLITEQGSQLFMVDSGCAPSP